MGQPIVHFEVIGKDGAKLQRYYGELFGRRKDLPLFAKAMLADAMFVGGGDRGDARKLLQEILNHAKESAMLETLKKNMMIGNISASSRPTRNAVSVSSAFARPNRCRSKSSPPCAPRSVRSS